MSQIHFVGGEKGGVGKSTVTRLLAQEFIDRDLNFVALDGDRSHGDMLRFYADYSQPLNLQDNASADSILLSAIDADQKVLVDLPAQSACALESWVNDNGILELIEEMNIPLVVWHVMDGSRNSVDLLERSVNDFARNDDVAFVIVKNHGRGSNFTLFDKSEAKTAAEERGAHIVDLAALDDNVMSKIDWFGLSFWAAANLTDGECLSLLERQRVKMWRKHWQEQLEPIAGLIYGKNLKSAEVIQLSATS
jgi:hypothetical protein